MSGAQSSAKSSRIPGQTVPVFVVSLARAADRRRAICAHLDSLGIQYELIDAVDGAALDPGYVAKVVADPSTIHLGAVGCYLSHLSIYERVIRRAIDVALVLEDDARLDPRARRLLAAERIAPTFDYCFLDSDDHNDRGPIFYDASSCSEIAPGFRAYELSAGPQTTHAYLITNQAARKRLDWAFPITRPIDLYDHLPYSITFSAIVRPKLAWVSEHSMVSFTSSKTGSQTALRFAALRRFAGFYRLRDLVRLRGLRRNREATELVAQGRLAPGRKWRALPSGREILLGR